jgi:hypothetical protein
VYCCGVSAFSTEVRLLLCPRCGAPASVPPTGGTLHCAYCGATAVVAGRIDSFAGGLLSPEQERARIQRLWQQLRDEDAGGVADVYGIQNVLSDVLHLVPLQGADLRGPWQEAWAVARGRLQGEGSIEAQRRVYWLAVVGVNSDFEATHMRAILETALELLPDPGHHHVIRCVLSGLANRMGDSASAERWLAGCDPTPDNVSLDSAYRLGLAPILTRRQDWPRLLALVGAHPNELPLDGARRDAFKYFRVHALEALGHHEQAAEQLAGLMQSPGAAQGFERLAYLRICETTRARLGIP